MRIALLGLVLCLAGTACQTNSKALRAEGDGRLADLKLPPGFSIDYYATGISNARSLALGDKGTVFVGTRRGKSVVALVDTNRDGIADQRYVVAKGLNTPNGVAFHKGSLYIAEVSRIWRIDNIEAALEKPGKPVLITDRLPAEKQHGWKYIAFGPDDKLYVPIGAPCNVCADAEKDPKWASITRMNADGSGFEVYAHGVRNTVGLTWHPQSKEMWFTENGRDHLGDDLPADELNIASKKDEHFGFPYCHQGNIPDPEFGKGKSCADYKTPAGTLTPHGAALGLKFNTGKMFPPEYHNQVFIAEHGSWNRSEPIGYRVMLAMVEGNTVKSYTPFIDGWLKGGEAWGRPVDILFLPDGSMLISDDHADAVYRVAYTGK